MIPTDEAGMPQQFVYLMRAAGGLYKIGRSTSPAKRQREIEERAGPLSLVHTIPTNDSPWLEKQLHQQFASRHQGHEWFALVDADVAVLQSMSRTDRSGKKLPLNPPTMSADLLAAIRADARNLNELARDARVNYASLWRFAVGNRSLSMKIAARLCDALGLELVPKEKS